MPRGDRLKLKADPEDGTTPISNLLLEAVAMAHLPGLQTRAIIYLWRKTYGWVDGNGERKKRCEIGLTEWKDALNTIKSSVSTALRELEEKNIFIRTTCKQWGIYTYEINTEVRTWNSNCIDLDKLANSIQYAKAEQSSLATQSSDVEQSNSENRTVIQDHTLQYGESEHPTLYKENINKDKERGGKKNTTNKNDEIPKNLSPDKGLKANEVFKQLDELRGYRPTKRKAEAAAILRMLKLYSTEQIISVYKTMKEEKFWTDKELFMMTVESQIGAKLNSSNNKQPKHQSEVTVKK